jgi:hypothetical protein
VLQTTVKTLYTLENINHLEFRRIEKAYRQSVSEHAIHFQPFCVVQDEVRYGTTHVRK